MIYEKNMFSKKKLSSIVFIVLNIFQPYKSCQCKIFFPNAFFWWI